MSSDLLSTRPSGRRDAKPGHRVPRARSASGASTRKFSTCPRLGGIASKGLTLHGSPGNSGERIYETPAGLMNSIGLENPGVRHFVKTEAPYMRTLGPRVIANLGGHSVADYVEGAELLDSADIDMLELNISCPNVKAGGMAFGMDPASAGDVVSRVRKVTRRPLLVKTDAVTHLTLWASRARAKIKARTGFLSSTPSLAWPSTSSERNPSSDNVYAGLSGPAIRPIALRMVHVVAHAVEIPVCGHGGHCHG